MKLQALRQKDGQDVRSFVRDLNMLLGKMRTRPDEPSLVFAFVGMLKPTKRNIMMQRAPEGGMWPTLDAAIKMAVIVESDMLRMSLLSEGTKGVTKDKSREAACELFCWG